jgi:hypothetical protein
MTRSIRIATLSIFIVASLCLTPASQALPRDWWIDTYYDCNLNEVGYHLFDCSGHHSYVGQQYGAYRESYQEECSTGQTVDYSWWWWDGSSWVPYTGQTC